MLAIEAETHSAQYIIKRNIFVMELEEQVPATFNADSEHKLLSSSVYEYIHIILF